MDDAALAKLEKLADMKSKGILTEEEFAQQKAAVLGGSGNASNQVASAPGMMQQPIMMQPGMMGNQRRPSVARRENPGGAFEPLEHHIDDQRSFRAERRPLGFGKTDLVLLTRPGAA